MSKFVTKYLIFDLAGLGAAIPTTLGAQNQSYPPVPPTPAPAPAPRRGRLRRLFTGAPSTALSATVDTRTSVSVRIERVRPTFHPNHRRLAIPVRLKRVDRIQRLLLRVFKDYDPAQDDPTPRAANLVYSEVLTHDQIVALPDADPTREDSVQASMAWATALGDPAAGAHAGQGLRVVVWVSSEENGWLDGADPELEYGVEVHDRALHPDRDPDDLREALDHANAQNNYETDPDTNQPWHVVKKRLATKVGYLSDARGRNLTRLPAARTIRVAQLRVSTSIEGDARYRRRGDMLLDRPRDLAKQLRRALEAAEAHLDDEHQPDEAYLRALGYPPLRVFMAPEWFFRPHARPYTAAERKRVRAKLARIARNFPGWVIVPGTIYWSPTDPATAPLKVFNECPIYVFGEHTQTLTKVNEHDLTVAAKATASEMWGMDDLDRSGLRASAIASIRNQRSTFDVTPTEGHLGTVTFCADICRDQVVGVGARRYAAAGGAGVDVHLLVSSETTPVNHFIAARDGGLFSQLDGDNLNAEVARVARAASVQALVPLYQDLDAAVDEQDRLYADVVRADDALKALQTDVRFRALDAERGAMVTAFDAEQKVADVETAEHERGERRWGLLADALEEAGRDEDAAYARSIGDAVGEVDEARHALSSSTSATDKANAERALAGQVKRVNLSDEYGHVGSLVLHNLIELP